MTKVLRDDCAVRALLAHKIPIYYYITTTLLLHYYYYTTTTLLTSFLHIYLTTSAVRALLLAQRHQEKGENLQKCLLPHSVGYAALLH